MTMTSRLPLLWLAGLAVTGPLAAQAPRAARPALLATARFTAHDHTAIMEALIANRPAVLAALGANRSPSGAQGLNAMLGVPAVAQPLKAKIRVVASAPVRNFTPVDGNRTLAALDQALSQATSVNDMIQSLRGAAAQNRRLAPGIQLAISLLQDGASTIYSPQWVSRYPQSLPAGFAPAPGAQPQSGSFWGKVWAFIKGTAKADAEGAITAFNPNTTGCGVNPSPECLNALGQAGMAGAIASVKSWL